MNESEKCFTDDWPTARTGYVALFGRPNTGKSTFVNTVLDYHLAAVSSKPQTTRRRCMGIYSDTESQLIFLDCPGVHVPKSALDEAMSRAVEMAIEDADVILCIVDPTRKPGQEDRMVAEHAAEGGKPVILAFNKGDLTRPGQVEDMRSFYGTYLPDVPCFDICAKCRDTLSPLLEKLKLAMPVGPCFYAPDSLTDQYERDIGSELIREALLEILRQEVPHSMAVVVDGWKEKEKRVGIRATLYVEREGQKGIVIGRNGEMLNRIRRRAVTKLREMLDKHIRLKLWVKVAPDWRNRQQRVKDFI